MSLYNLNLLIDKKLYNNGHGFYYFRPVLIINGPILKALVEYDGNIHYNLVLKQDQFNGEDFHQFEAIIMDYLDVFVLFIDSLSNNTIFSE
ncbi:hypothetical protein HZY86_06385 [Aerococcaceae bacterium DSM 111020]|nr:hypothetical protein [Aerococcaceae bacterium DSM 111020]